MAQKFRKIDPRIWRDEKFAALKPEDKLIALYCLTAQSNRCGIFVFSPAMAAEELGMSQGTFRERFEGVVCALRWEWDATLRVLYLPTWWRYNQPENANVLIGNLGDLAELPNTPLIARFLTNFEHLKPTYRIQVGKKWEELEIQALFAKAPRASSVSTGNVSAPGNGSHKEPLGNVPPNVGGNVGGVVLAQEQEQEQKQEQEQEKRLPPSGVCPKPPKPAASGPPVLTAPTVGEPTEWHLTAEKLAEYEKAFPNLDVLAALRAAMQWCRDNPTNRKTAKGMPRFCSTWLGTCVNRGQYRRTNQQSAPPPPKETALERAMRVAREAAAQTPPTESQACPQSPPPAPSGLFDGPESTPPVSEPPTT